ncbi:MAG: IPTL-CTERM sorting domain-containing protein [Planctomycetes bacterium]|nr:IPTL-CTERM sorting domain-containing protein [Planctomycetota bacterium]
MPYACRTNCTLPTCSDTVTDEGEECYGTSDDACPGECKADCTCGIPTLSHWGLLSLAALLLALSKRHFTRRIA